MNWPHVTSCTANDGVGRCGCRARPPPPRRPPPRARARRRRCADLAQPHDARRPISHDDASQHPHGDHASSPMPCSISPTRERASSASSRIPAVRASGAIGGRRPSSSRSSESSISSSSSRWLTPRARRARRSFQLVDCRGCRRASAVRGGRSAAGRRRGRATRTHSGAASSARRVGVVPRAAHDERGLREQSASRGRVGARGARRSHIGDEHEPPVTEVFGRARRAPARGRSGPRRRRGRAGSRRRRARHRRALPQRHLECGPRASAQSAWPSGWRTHTSRSVAPPSVRGAVCDRHSASALAEARRAPRPRARRRPRPARPALDVHVAAAVEDEPRTVCREMAREEGRVRAARVRSDAVHRETVTRRRSMEHTAPDAPSRAPSAPATSADASAMKYTRSPSHTASPRGAGARRAGGFGGQWHESLRRTADPQLVDAAAAVLPPRPRLARVPAEHARRKRRKGAARAARERRGAACERNGVRRTAFQRRDDPRALAHDADDEERHLQARVAWHADAKTTCAPSRAHASAFASPRNVKRHARPPSEGITYTSAPPPLFPHAYASSRPSGERSGLEQLPSVVSRRGVGEPAPVVSSSTSHRSPSHAKTTPTRAGSVGCV